MNINKLRPEDSKGIFNTFLIVILITGIFLRFNNLNERGLSSFDEGIYFSEARFVNEGFDFILKNGFKRNVDFEKLKAITNGIPPITGKLGYTLVLFLFNLIFGIKDSSALYASVVFGILNLILIFIIAKAIFDKWVALIAMAVASVSAYHVYYSTIAFSEMVGVTFFLLGFWCYWFSLNQPKRKSFLIFSGLSVGYAFTCNQWRWAPLPLFIIFFEFIRLLKRELPVKDFFKRALIFSFAFFVPIVAFQLPYQILLWIKGELPFRSYFGQLVQRTSYGGQMVLSLKDSDTFLKYFWIIEGPIFTALLTLGLVCLAISILRKKKNEDIFIFTIWVASFIVFSLFRYGGESLLRTISMIVPFTPIIIACLLGKIKKSFFIYAVIFLFLVFGYKHCLPVAGPYPAYRQLCEYIKERGYKKLFILDNEAVFRAYAGRIAYKPYDRPKNAKELLQVSRETGIDRVVVDFYVLHSKFGMEYVKQLVQDLKPEVEFYNPLARSFARLTDLYGYDQVKKILADPQAVYLGIYNLKDISIKR